MSKTKNQNQILYIDQGKKLQIEIRISKQSIKQIIQSILNDLQLEQQKTTIQPTKQPENAMEVA